MIITHIFTRENWFTRRERTAGYTYDRLYIPFLLSGAINRTVFAGHIRCLGVEYGWNGGPNETWADTRHLSLWGIVCFIYQDTKAGTLKHTGKPGLTVRWLRLEVKAAVRRARPW